MLIVPQYQINAQGQYGVVVANPSPGGGVANEKVFDVKAGIPSNVPTILELRPPTIRAGSSGFFLTALNATLNVPFQDNAWINFGTVRLDRMAGGSESITVFVPAFLIGSPGIVPVTVSNPGNPSSTGGTSTRVFFTVN